MINALKRSAIVVGVVAASGCVLDLDDSGDLGNDVEVSESFSFQLDASGASGLTFEGVNGELIVNGDGAATDVTVVGYRRVASNTSEDATDFLARVSVEVTDLGSEILVRTVQPVETGGRNVTVDYDVTIPTDFDAYVTHVNGPIEVRSLTGEIGIEHINGAVDLSDIIGDVEVDLVNGNVAADLTPGSGGTIDVFAVNGTIDVSVPTSASAMIEADVVNGTVSVIGLVLTDATTSIRSVHGRLGGGDGLIDLGATNGTITLRGR